MDAIANDCKLKKCCCCIPLRYGVYIIGLMISLALMESLIMPFIPISFLQDLQDYADTNMKVYFYIKAGLELMLIMSYISMIVKDSRQTRDIVYRAYILYVLIVTGLSLFIAFFPSEGSRQLDHEAITEYCEQLDDADLPLFDNIDDCLTKASLNFRRNELIFINIQFFF